MHYAYMGNVTIEVIFWVKAFSVKPPTNLKTVCQIEIVVCFEYQNCKVPEIPCWAMLCKFEVTCVVSKRVQYVRTNPSCVHQEIWGCNFDCLIKSVNYFCGVRYTLPGSKSVAIFPSFSSFPHFKGSFENMTQRWVCKNLLLPFALVQL